MLNPTVRLQIKSILILSYLTTTIVAFRLRTGQPVTNVAMQHVQLLCTFTIENNDMSKGKSHRDVILLPIIQRFMDTSTTLYNCGISKDKFANLNSISLMSSSEAEVTTRCLDIGVNIGELKSGTERTKKRKKRELVFFPTARWQSTDLI